MRSIYRRLWRKRLKYFKRLRINWILSWNVSWSLNCARKRWKIINDLRISFRLSSNILTWRSKIKLSFMLLFKTESLYWSISWSISYVFSCIAKSLNKRLLFSLMYYFLNITWRNMIWLNSVLNWFDTVKFSNRIWHIF
jgi:hypothetical protein